jgi:hypothetical protein
VWLDDSRTLAQRLALTFGVNLEETPLTDRLVEFRLVPFGGDCAAIGWFASAEEIIVFAGEGTRVELGALEESQREVEAIVGSVARGGLTETIAPRGVEFLLRMDGSTDLTGSKRGAGIPVVNHTSTVHYAPWGPQSGT